MRRWWWWLDPCGDLNDKLDDLIASSRVTFQQLRSVNMALQELIDALAKIDAATNNIAADIANLKEQIAVGMSPAEVAAVQAALDAAAVKLEGIASSTDDPVPE